MNCYFCHLPIPNYYVENIELVLCCHPNQIICVKCLYSDIIYSWNLNQIIADCERCQRNIRASELRGRKQAYQMSLEQEKLYYQRKNYLDKKSNRNITPEKLQRNSNYPYGEKNQKIYQNHYKTYQKQTEWQEQNHESLRPPLSYQKAHQNSTIFIRKGNQQMEMEEKFDKMNYNNAFSDQIEHYKFSNNPLLIQNFQSKKYQANSYFTHNNSQRKMHAQFGNTGNFFQQARQANRLQNERTRSLSKPKNSGQQMGKVMKNSAVRQQKEHSFGEES